jgi:phosphomannomutase
MKVDPAIFKAYDIRGIYGENLDEKWQMQSAKRLRQF